jgi:hypothetical protein
MKDKSLKLYNRRTIRKNGHDCNQEAVYFITIICQNKWHIFGSVENGVMKLNEYGQVEHDGWYCNAKMRPDIQLGIFVVMPNHIHGIVCFGGLHFLYSDIKLKKAIEKVCVQWFTSSTEIHFPRSHRSRLQSISNQKVEWF